MMEVAVKLESKPVFTLPVKEDETGIFAVEIFDDETNIVGLEEEDSDDMSEPLVPRRKRFVPKYEVDGVARMVLSEETQIHVGTSVGTDLTSEQPWMQAEKAAILDHIETNGEKSELYPLRKYIEDYPEKNILIGYIPDESKDYEEFYICYTLKAKEHCLQQSEKFKRRQDKKIEKSIYRKVRPWVSLGSDKEIDGVRSINKRSLIEVEITSRFPKANQPDKFTVREARDARDGYVELTPYRAKYDIVTRLRVDRAIQVAPAKISSSAQTVLRYPQNVWTQSMTETVGKAESEKYNEEGANIEDDSTDTQSKPESEEDTVDKSKTAGHLTSHIRRLNEFVLTVSEKVSNVLELNTAMDIYSNDYPKLVTSSFSTKYDSMHLEEYICFTDMQAKDKYIIHASFHHFWSGVVAVAYSYATPSIIQSVSSREDPVHRAVYGQNSVLIWSHVDSLRPKLYLESDREVKFVSFCPFNENILVGGCINGQVVIWDISNKLEKAEEFEHISETQEKFRMTISSQMNWMKSIHDKAIVRSTAVSNLLYSHQASITNIRWLSPNYTVTSTGRVTKLKDDEKRSEIFLTASVDATILIWSLDITHITFIQGKKIRKSTRIQKKPAGLTVDVSPYIVLDRTIQPIYKIMLGKAGVISRFSMQSMALDLPALRYIPVNRNPGSGRKYFKCEIIEEEGVIHPIRVYGGSVYGEIMKFSWDGHEFNTGEVVNTEYCNIHFRSKLHDGPITCIVQNPFFKTAFISLGGKVFALWSDHFDRPIFWKKRLYRLTDAMWSQHKPSIFFICTSDGNIEVWDYLLRGDEPIHVQTVSGTLITGIYLHRRQIPKDMLGIGDTNGSFRIFMLPSIFTLTHASYYDRIQQLFQRQVMMKNKFRAWQDKWAQENASFIQEQLRNEKSALAERELQKRHELEVAQQKKEEELEAKRLEKNRIIGPEERWTRIITKLIEATIAIKKRINKAELYAQVKPLRELEEQRIEKEKKMQEIMKNQEHIFKETVAILFPEAVSIEEDDTFKMQLGKKGGGKKQYMKDYKGLAALSADEIKSKPFIYSFDWKSTLAEGVERRRALDCFSAVLAKHRRRIMLDRGDTMAAPDLQQKFSSFEPVSLGDGDQSLHKVSFN